MNLQEALARIESPEFDAELNLVSGSKSFFRAIAGDSMVKILMKSMNETGEGPEQILGRIYDLSMLETDPHYENPNDTALAVLLWLTTYTDSQLANVGAHYVQRAPRCWYATHLANQVIAPSTSGSSEYRPSADVSGERFSHNSSTSERRNAVSTSPKLQIVPGSTGRMPRAEVSDNEHHMVQLSVDSAYVGNVESPVGGQALRTYTSRSQNLEVGNPRRPREATYVMGA